MSTRPDHHSQSKHTTQTAQSQQRSDIYISPKEAASLLCVATWTLARWAEKGIIKAMRVNPRGERRYYREEIETIAKNGGDHGQP